MSERKINIIIGYYNNISTIDANLHPEEQVKLLLNILEDAFKRNFEFLNIYTNSIYILNKLIVLQGYVYNNIDCDYFKYKLDFPIDCLEIKKDGSVINVSKYKSLISDDNLLNNFIEDSNEEYSKILIKKQEQCQKEK